MLKQMVSVAVLFGAVAHADLASVADHYKQRYNARSVFKDYITNENLKHLKRMKVALDGVLYWGGGRYGSTHLGSEAVYGLCEEGFSKAIYVYRTSDRLKGATCSNGSTEYLNILYSSKGNYPALESFLKLVKHAIDNPDEGPIYLHCWNGIHASSQMAAIALRQFCGLTGEQGERVFRENSEGTYKEYAHVARGIENFKPYSGLEITPDQRRIVCNTALNSF